MPNLSTIHILREADGVFFGDVTYAPGSTLGPRHQADFQAVILLQGALTVTVGRTTIELPAQTVLFLKPGHEEYFVFSARAPSRHVWCTVGVEHLRDVETALIGLPGTLPLTRSVQALIEVGLAMPEPGTPLRDQVLVTTGHLLMQQIALEAEQRTWIARVPAPVRAAQAFIQARLGEHLELAAIARAANVSPQHLARLFRNQLGVSPMRYVWALRCVRGAEMLVQTGLPVAEIAALLGYQTPYHFSRAIRDRHGLSPREFRKRSWR